MKKLQIGLVFVSLFIFVSAWATPFLICDPPLAGEPIPTNYQLTGGTWVPASVPAKPDGTIYLDLVGAPVGTNSITVKACGVADEVWEECSEPVPFSFTRPTVPLSPKTLRLSQ